MAGHPSLSLKDERKSHVPFNDKMFEVSISFHNFDGINGDVVGLKFSDSQQSMDPSKKVNINGLSLGKVLAKEVIRMPGDLNNISFLGFYLLTDDILENRG
jgi:hypothetical protein